MSETRIETDSLGDVEVPVDSYYGAQTQHSLQNFDIGTEKMPAALVRALGIAILMVAALVTHLRLKSPGHRMLPSFALLCICSYLAFLCSQLLPTAG